MGNRTDIDQLARISRMDTLSVEQAAQLLHLGRDATRALIDTGELPAASCNRKHTVLLRTDVLEYIARQAREQSEARRATTPRKNPRRRRGPLPDLSRFSRHMGGNSHDRD